MLSVSQIPVILRPSSLSMVLPDALSFLPCYSPPLTSFCVILLLLLDYVYSHDLFRDFNKKNIYYFDKNEIKYSIINIQITKYIKNTKLILF